MTEKSERKEERVTRKEEPYELKYSGKLSDYIRSKVAPVKKPVSQISKTRGKNEIKLSEDQVISVCTPFLKQQGWISHTLFTGGIPIGSGRYATNPCKGICDAICFHMTKNKLIWIEYKKSHGGIISADQEYWHKSLRECGQIVFVVNSLESLKEQYNETFGKD
jgi:hypothetical protein